jgi:hypothetical protein
VKFLETKMKLFPVNKRGGFFQQRSSFSSNKQLIAIHNGSPPFMVSSRFKPVTVKMAHVS